MTFPTHHTLDRIPAPPEWGVTARSLLGGLPHYRGGSYRAHEYVDSTGLYPQLYAVTRLIRPNSILEIGCFWGYSMTTMLQAATGCSLAVCVDAEVGAQNNDVTNYLGKAAENIETVVPEGCDFQMHRADARVSTPSVVFDHEWDMVYVDGDHTVAGVQDDLDLAASVVRPGGAILVDDVHWLEEVSVGVREWLTHPRVAGVVEVLTRTHAEPRGLYLIQCS